MSLESCPMSKRRPENLLDHPVILPKAVSLAFLLCFTVTPLPRAQTDKSFGC